MAGRNPDATSLIMKKVDSEGFEPMTNCSGSNFANQKNKKMVLTGQDHFSSHFQRQLNSASFEAALLCPNPRFLTF